MADKTVSAHKTTISFVIYSDEPIEDDLGVGLESLVWTIEEGDNIGDWTIVSSEVVEGDELRAQLVAIGNDGHFFDGFEDDDDE